MPAFTYEGMFLLDSAKAATAWDDTVKHVHDILTKHQSEIVASRQWDERRLAYTIDGHKKGTYLLTYFKTDGSNLKEIVADCHLSDVILRELVLKVHPKLADHLVNQAMTSTPNADAEGAGEDEMDERPAAVAATTATDLLSVVRGGDAKHLEYSPVWMGDCVREGEGRYQRPARCQLGALDDGQRTRGIFTLVDAAGM